MDENATFWYGINCFWKKRVPFLHFRQNVIFNIFDFFSYFGLYLPFCDRQHGTFLYGRTHIVGPMRVGSLWPWTYKLRFFRRQQNWHFRLIKKKNARPGKATRKKLIFNNSLSSPDRRNETPTANSHRVDYIMTNLKLTQELGVYFHPHSSTLKSIWRLESQRVTYVSLQSILK